MKMNEKAYEPPKTKIYRFGDNDKILTESGTTPDPDPDYAANALNEAFGGINTTME